MKWDFDILKNEMKFVKNAKKINMNKIQRVWDVNVFNELRCHHEMKCGG